MREEGAGRVAVRAACEMSLCAIVRRPLSRGRVRVRVRVCRRVRAQQLIRGRW